MKPWWLNADRQPILITGSIRSGTTFLGKVLAEVKGSAFINEPFNLHNNALYGLNWERQYQFIEDKNFFSQDSWLQFQAALRLFHPNEVSFLKKVSGVNLLRNKALLLRDTLKPIQRVVIKDPIALASAPFLAKEFNAKVLYCVRHPAGFVASMKKLGWYIHPNYFLAQPKLIKTYLQEFEEELHYYKNTSAYSLELTVLMWNVANTMVYKQMQSNKEAIFVRHEDYSLEPMAYFESLFKQLHLDFSIDIQRFIEKTTHSKNLTQTTASDPHNIHINSKEVVNKWKTKLDASEVAYIKEHTKKIYPLFYSDISW